MDDEKTVENLRKILLIQQDKIDILRDKLRRVRNNYRLGYILSAFIVLIFTWAT